MRKKKVIFNFNALINSCLNLLVKAENMARNGASKEEQ